MGGQAGWHTLWLGRLQGGDPRGATEEQHLDGGKNFRWEGADKGEERRGRHDTSISMLEIGKNLTEY